jgi:ribosomal-protein-alanine N-acetyltransferase
VGTICLWNFDYEMNAVELGYELLPHWQGKGLMSEAARKVVEFAFGELGADAVNACPSDYNFRSVALLARLGFIKNKATTHDHSTNENLLTFNLSKENFF